MNRRPISEDDLHAHVDQALDPERQTEVAAYLATHPDVARRVDDYVRQRDEVYAALAPIAEEPVPAELDVVRMVASHRRPDRTWWRVAAVFVLLSVGGAGGWALRGMVVPTSEGIAALAQEAADNYRVYAPDRVHPVEIRDRAELVDWVSRRLGRQMPVPDLSASGYRFMGGRVVATAHGPAVLYMYDNGQGARLVMLTRPMDVDRNVPMSQHARDAAAGFVWAAKGIGYGLFGPVPSTALHPIANEVRRQIDADT